MSPTDRDANLDPVPFIDLGAQYRRLKADIDAAIAGVLEDGRFVLGQPLGTRRWPSSRRRSPRDDILCRSRTRAPTRSLARCGTAMPCFDALMADSRSAPDHFPTGRMVHKPGRMFSMHRVLRDSAARRRDVSWRDLFHVVGNDMPPTDRDANLDPVAFIDLGAQYRRLKADIDAAIAGVLEDGRFVLGPAVAESRRRSPRVPVPPTRSLARAAPMPC